MNRARPFLPLLLPALFFLLLLLSTGSLFLAKKALVFLFLPAGLVWVVLTFLPFWPGLRVPVRVFFGLLWGLYSFAGNPMAGNLLLRSLEAPFAERATPDEPLDLLFVLGGGTALGLDGTPRTGTAGDRILTAARLYRKGMVRKLAASGRSVTEKGGDRILSGEAVAIWVELGVPEADTMQFTRPRDTREEIEDYTKFLAAHPEIRRVGICTSAWHMKRALKLGREMNFSPIPVPADFRSRPIPPITINLIPRMRGFAHVQMALWEYLAYWLD